MKPRHRTGFGLLIAMVVVLSGVPALAAGTAARSTSKADALMATVQWNLGNPSPFAGTRFDGEYVSSNGRVYFTGFRTLGDATDGSVWYYQVNTQTYTDTGVDMPFPVSNYKIAALTDANGLGLYIFGGRNPNNQIIRTVQVYYPTTNTTAVISTDPWPGRTPVGCISLPAMGVVASGNRATVMGGMSFAASGCSDDQSAQTWSFNPMAPAGSRWTQLADLNVARGYITAAVLNNRIYAIGGDTILGGALTAVQTVETKSVAGGNWNDAGVADLPVACDEAQAFGFTTGPLARGIVLAGCGQWPNAIPDTHFYDQATNAWSVIGTFNDNRRNHAGALVPAGGGRQLMYILGGFGEDSSFIDPITSSEIGRGNPASHPSGAGSSSSGTGSGVPTS